MRLSSWTNLRRDRREQEVCADPVGKYTPRGGGTGAPNGGQWASVEPGQGRRIDVIRWQEVRGTTPSRLQEATMHRVSVSVRGQQQVLISSITLYSLYYCFRKINHFVTVPFAFIRWCTWSRVGNTQSRRKHIRVISASFHVHWRIFILALLLSNKKHRKTCHWSECQTEFFRNNADILC
jgi:hypothetical protein